jgi:indolepyruvate ferredoxin oxidoreductase alpha subunit
MKSSASSKRELLLSGNEAIALGAYEAGVGVASSYPGTPATEILKSLMRYKGVYAEWAPNEKVAVEMAMGASFAGVRSMASMKHVGLNNAADPLFTSSYIGVRGGMVIVTADDPGMYSSQNEQDNRNYALAAKVPMLEPSDPAEAKEFTKLAFALSERFDIPFLLRTTTRVSHVKGVVTRGRTVRSKVKAGIKKDIVKLVMLPPFTNIRRADLEQRTERLKKFAETFKHNRIEWGDRKVGFITSGVSYLYVKEAFATASVLKLGMVHPLPEKLIKSFAKKIDKLYVVEELDPFLELQVKALGISCKGKELIPSQGELSQAIVKASITGKSETLPFKPVRIPGRAPVMCPGCSYRGVFYTLSRLKVFVAGDIGCYTLSALKPLCAIDSVICMGAGISTAHGMDKALGQKARGRVVSVIGDSTFIHSGITGLIDIVHNRGASTVVLLDNGVTAMTGLQPTPASGINASGEKVPALDFEALGRAIGLKHIYTIDPYDLKTTQKVLKREIDRPEPSLVIARGPCVLLPEVRNKKEPSYGVLADDCTGCRRCLAIGCPAVSWTPSAGKKKKGRASISGALCTGCGLCVDLCNEKAIVKDEY